MTPDRAELRNVFFQAWRKYTEQLPLEPLEVQLVDLILSHPEYQPVLQNPDNIETDHSDQDNPYLHMSLHLAIREQVATNRPAGIQSVYQTLSEKTGDRHIAEHHMMECLADFLWQAQQSGRMPNELLYLEKLTSSM